MQNIFLIFFLSFSTLGFSYNCERVSFFIDKTISEIEGFDLTHTQDPYNDYVEGYLACLKHIKEIMDSPQAQKPYREK